MHVQTLTLNGAKKGTGASGDLKTAFTKNGVSVEATASAHVDELDGLLRVTRQAEAYYHQSASADTPVVLLPGLTHWSIS